jgi:ATP-dependent DNA helicase RecQ
LRAIAEHRPLDLDALARISGVGASKQARYGEQVLEVVREEKGASPN